MIFDMTSAASALGILAVLAAYTTVRRPPRPLWPVLVITQVCALLYVGGDVAVSVAPAASERLTLWLLLKYGAAATLPAGWWYLAVRYAELQRQPVRGVGSRWIHAPFWITVVLAIAWVTTAWHGRMFAGHPAVRSGAGWLWWIHVAWAYALLVSALAIYTDAYLRARTPAVRLQAAIMLAAQGVAFVATALYVFRPMSVPFDPTDTALAASALLFVVGSFATGLWSLLPLALAEITRCDADGVLVIRRDGRVLYANPAAHHLLPADSLAPGKDVFAQLIDALKLTDDGDGPLTPARLADQVLGTAGTGNGPVYAFGPAGDRWVRIIATPLSVRRAWGTHYSLRMRDITEFRLATDTVAGQAAALEGILGSAQEGLLVVDRAGAIVYYNRLFQQMWSLPDEIMTTGEDATALDYVRQQLADPERFLARVRELYADAFAVSRDEVALRDGRLYDRTSHPLVRDGVAVGRVWSFRDVTRERKAQLVLQRNEEQYRGMFDGALDAVFTFDAWGLVRSWNRAAEQIFGWQAEEIVGREVTECIVPPRLRADFRAMLATHREDAGAPTPDRAIAFPALRRDGTEFPSEVSLSVISVQGTTRYLVFVRDVTERHEAQRTLRTQRNLLRGVAEATKLLLTADEYAVVLPRVLETLGHAVEADRVYLLRCRPHGPSGACTVRLVDLWATTEPMAACADAKTRDLEVGAAVWEAWAAAAQAGDIIHDGAPDGLPVFGALFSHEEAQACMLAPVVLGGALWGLLGVDDCARARTWASDEESTLRTVASGLANAIEREQHQKALAQSERRYRRLVDDAPLGIVAIDTEGDVRAINPALVHMLGAPSAEAVRGGSPLRPNSALDEQLQGIARACLEHGAEGAQEVEATTAWGKEVYLRVHYAPMRDATGAVIGAQGLVEDIAARKRAEDALRESEARYRRLVENAPLGVIACDRDGNVATVNQYLAEMLGSPSVEATTRLNLLTLPPLVEVGIADAIRTSLRTGEGHVGEYTYTSVWGRTVEIRLHLAPVRDRDAAVVGVQAIVEDITERKRAEAALLHTQKLESLGVLAGGIAHDFNNLLVSIMGNASLAHGDTPSGSAAERYLDQIERAAERASDLTQQLLAYAGKGKFVIKPLDLTDVVEEMTHLLDVSIAKNVTVEYDLAPDLPAVDADPAQVRQVVMNLVINASDAIGTAQGAVTVRTGVRELGADEVDAAGRGQPIRPGRYVVLEVRDTGCGMDTDTQKRIFDPFFTTKFTGRGLGLAAVLGIVHGHKGAMQVQSARGEGSTFTVLLPATAAPAPRVAAPAAPAGTWSGAGTILVVDDDPGVLDVAQSILENAGFAVLLAADGVRALELVEAHGDAVDVVLLDLTMPRMGGDETAAALHARWPRLPVVLSSGYSEHEARQRINGSGLAGFVQKPYRSHTLVATVREALQARAVA